jgi:hypothetical protein
MVIRMSTLSQATLSQALTVLDAAQKYDDWIAAHQQQGDPEKITTAFAAWQEADARKRKIGYWRLLGAPE